MVKVFRKLFSIFPGEERRACLFACLAFIWALGVTCGSKFADALFLIHVGAESLPTAYTLTACGLLVAASFLLYAFHVIDPYRIFLSVILVGAVFYASIYGCLIMEIAFQTQWIWFLLKIFGYLLFSIVLTCFWLFVDQYYHLQDAKRLFTLFNSAIFVGAASTGLLMRSGVLDLNLLMIVIVVLLLIASYLVIHIAKRVVPVYDDTSLESGTAQEQKSLKYLFKMILSSRFTLFLMVSNFLTQLLMVITEYNYMTSFQQHFLGEGGFNIQNDTEAGLTLFLGQWIATVSIANLFFGLFIYSRLVGRFGVSSLTVITPLLLLTAFSGWLTSDSLLFPLMGLFVVEGTLYVVDDSNFSLLLNAVPSKVKQKIRVIIESFFEPIGMLVSGILLTISPLNSRILGLVLSAFAVVVALGVRSQYLKALFRNLADNAIHLHRLVQDWLGGMKPKEKKAAEHHLLAILKLGDENAQIFACEGLISFEDITILQKILQFADELSVTAKITFLKMIEQSPFATEGLVLDHLHSWIRDSDDLRLKSAVHLYLAKQGLLHPEKAMGDLESGDLALKAAAIIALKKSWANQSPSMAAFNRTVAAQHLEALLDSQDEDELCIGITILGAEPVSHNVDMLLPFLKHPSRKVARTAILSISQIIDKSSIRHAPALISYLNLSKDNEFRLACLKALEKIADSTIVRDIIGASVHFRANERRLTEALVIKMGLRTVPTLLSITKDTSMHDRCRTLSGKILGQLALPQLHANLYEIISVEIEKAYFYFYHHHMIQSEDPNVDLSILKDALLTGFHSVIDFIIQMLGAAGSLEDCELLSRSLRSRSLKVRSQVVETLEKACDSKVFTLLYPLVSDLPLEEKLRAYTRGGREPLSLTQLLDKMDQSASLADRIVAAALKYRLNMPNWRESLRQQMTLSDEIFHHFAYELLETKVPL